MKEKIQKRIERIDADIKFFTEQMQNGIMPLSCAESIRNLEAAKANNMKNRFKVTQISKATGYTDDAQYNSLSALQQDYNSAINDPSYAVRIWDRKIQDYILYQ